MQKCCKPGETITGEFYGDSVLSEVKNVHKKARSNAEIRGIKLLHDNAPSHYSSPVQEYLAKEGTETFATPCILALGPCCLRSVPRSSRQSNHMKTM